MKFKIRVEKRDHVIDAEKWAKELLRKQQEVELDYTFLWKNLNNVYVKDPTRTTVSLVDTMKTSQIAYNQAMNKLGIDANRLGKIATSTYTDATNEGLVNML